MTKRHGSIRPFSLLLSTAAATLILVGCGQHEESLGTQIDGAVAKVGQGAAQVVESVQDAAITAQIKAEFAKDPVLGALQIQVSTQEGLVSLNGRAPDASTRDHATRVAVKVKDVLSVDNHMKLPG